MPPARPLLPADRDLQLGLRVSVGIHAVVMIVILLKSLIFPNDSKPYHPSLRVDMIGLPDLLKSEKKNLPTGQASLNNIKEMLEKAEEDANRIKPAKLPPPPKEPPAEKAAPDELVLKPKPAQQEKTQKLSKKEEAARDKRMKAALQRMKALSRIEADTSGAPPIKGNKISKGTSLDGDARESNDANYYDAVRSKLQENWALPVWLSRQKLSAQVEIIIDNRGRVSSFRFVKVSGNAQFDDAVKRTLSESQPFAQPPADLVMNGILIGFPL